MTPGKLGSKAVVEDLEEKKPKRGARCGAANPKPYTTRPRADESLEAEASRSVAAGDLDGRESEPVGPTTVSAREDNGKGERGLDEGLRLRGERSP
jgi:hypothetical protein